MSKKMSIPIIIFLSIVTFIIIYIGTENIRYSVDRDLLQKAHIENSTDGPGRSLRVAAAQMISENGDVEGNLKRATGLVEKAAASGAKLILLPEFMPPGYIFTEEIWKGGEPSNGPTVKWMKATSKRLGVWLGTSFLEADGEDFYNTFVLTNPEGKEDGRVRKQTPAVGEPFYTRGFEGSHVIKTRLGKIGVGICYENRLAYTPQNMYAQSVDLMLQPHAVPLPAESKYATKQKIEKRRQDFLDRPLSYAKMLGIPVVLSNHAGPWRSPIPGWKAMDTIFLGLSSIVDGDGTLRARLDTEEGVVVADVTLDPVRKKNVPPVTYGMWSVPGRQPHHYYMLAVEAIGAVWYHFSDERKARAREISSRR